MGAERVGIGAESSVAGAGEDGSIVFTGMDERGKGKERRERWWWGEEGGRSGKKKTPEKGFSVFVTYIKLHIIHIITYT